MTEAQVNAVVDIMAGCHGLGFRLLHEMAVREPERNVLLASYNTAVALAMTAKGTVGQSRQELMEVMGVGALSDETMRFIHSWLREVLAENVPFVLTNVSSLWLANDAAMKPEFMEECRSDFGAIARSVDFHNPETVNVINDWICHHTERRQPKFLSSIDPVAIIYIITAFYFDGAWAKPFKESETRLEPFYLANGQTRTVPTMSAMGIFPDYWEGEGFQAIGLRFSGGATFYILLPDEGVTPDDVVSRLDPNDWKDRSGVMKAHWERPEYDCCVDLKMPRFQVDWRGDLKNALRVLGVNCVFEHDCADFSRLTDDTVWISHLWHGATLEVDEKGVRASGVTVVEALKGAHLLGEVRSFVVNRPFVVVLRHHRASLPLLMGIIRDPGDESRH